MVSRPVNHPAQLTVGPSRSQSSLEVKRKRGRPQELPEQPSSASDSPAYDRSSEDKRKRGKLLHPMQPDTGGSPMVDIPGATLRSSVLTPTGGMSLDLPGTVLFPTSSLEVEVETSEVSLVESPRSAANNEPVHEKVPSTLRSDSTVAEQSDSDMRINQNLRDSVPGASSPVSYPVPPGGHPLIRCNTKVARSLPRLSEHPIVSFASPEIPILSAKPSLQMIRRQPFHAMGMPTRPSGPRLRPVGSTTRAIITTLNNLGLGRPMLQEMNRVIQMVLDYPESQLDAAEPGWAAPRVDDLPHPYLESESEEELAASEDIVSDSTGDTDKDEPVNESLQELSKLKYSKANT